MSVEGATLLAQLVKNQPRTQAEIVENFNSLAVKLGEKSRVSPRTFARWLKAESWPGPSAQRVAKEMWGYSMDQLLSKAQAGSEVSYARKTDTVVAELEFDPQHLFRATESAQDFLIHPADYVPNQLGLDDLREEVVRLASRYVQGVDMAGTIRRLLKVQSYLLDLVRSRRYGPRHGVEVFGLTATASGLLAKACQDLGNPDQARTLARVTQRLGQELQNAPTRAWALGQLSLIEYRVGNFRLAENYARAGIAAAEGSRGSTAIWCHSLRARALSRAGQHELARSEIAFASRLRETRAHDEIDSFGGLFDFTPEKQQYYAAGALANSRDPSVLRQADAEAHAALLYYSRPGAGFATECGVRSEIAVVRVRTRELEGVAEILRPVFDIPPNKRARGIVDSVTNVARLLAAGQNHFGGVGEELVDMIRDFEERAELLFSE